MDAYTDFGLINDLYDNIAIIGSDNHLIYSGKSLNNILHSANIKLSNLILENSNSKNLQLFLNEIKYVQNNNEPKYITFPGIDKELIIFPSNKHPEEIIFIGLKEKILHISEIEHERKERVKELQCLYDISKELDKSEQINTVLDNCAKLIKKSFQFPDDTTVNIKINNKNYGDVEFINNEFHKSLTSDDITLGEEKIGEIKVYSKNNLGFLEEEQKLINEIAGKISTLIEKEDRTRYLEKQQKILTAKNDALLKLTEECFQKREKLSTFFKAIADIIIVIDLEFNLIMSNKDEIGESGKCYQKLFKLAARCTDCAAVETFKTANNTFRERQNNSRYYTLRAYPILGLDGNVERVLEVCRDITSQKYLETQLLQSYKLASLGKLVAGVAHEINNPNTFILGNLKIVQEAFEDIFPILDNFYQEHNELKIARLNYYLFKENISLLISDMIKGANRTKKIVGDLRNFAKKDDGALIDEVDLNDIINNNLTLTIKQIKKHAQLEFELYDKLPVFKGSINKLEQVLLNLLMNASEAIVGDNGIIKIKTEFNPNTNKILLMISDNGIGMDESTLKNIFDPFFTTKRNKGGTGLGLSITYGIIKDHDGIIEVNSKVGEGTTFTIRIPANRK